MHFTYLSYLNKCIFCLHKGVRLVEDALYLTFSLGYQPITFHSLILHYLKEQAFMIFSLTDMS